MNNDKNKINFGKRWNDYSIMARLGVEVVKIAASVTAMVFLLKLILGAFVVMKKEHLPVHQKINNTLNRLNIQGEVTKEKLNNIEKGIDRIEKKL